MPMVTVVNNFTCRPTRAEAKQLIGHYIDELYQLYHQHFGIDGSVENWYWMAFPPGSYEPATAGVVVDRTVFGGVPGSVPWAFGITTEVPPVGNPWCLWVIKADPNADADASSARRDVVIQVQLSDDDGNFPDDPPPEQVPEPAPAPLLENLPPAKDEDVGPSSEYLVAWRTEDVNDPDDPDLSGHIKIGVIRKLPQSDTDRSEEATRLLQHYFGSTPLMELNHAEEELDEAFDDLLAAQPHSSTRHPGAQRLQSRYKNWLGAFGSFVDKSRHRISADFADDLATRDRCLEFFSDEFDANLGYRLAVILRNVSIHQDNVLNSLTMTNRAMDGCYSQYMVLPGIDLAEIVRRDTSGRIRPATAAEMVAIEGPVDARGIVTAVKLACHRIHARVIHMASTRIREAVDVTIAWDDEARAVGGDSAVFLNNAAALNPLTEQWTVRGNFVELADLALADLLRCQRLDSVRPRQITAADLTPVNPGLLEIPLTEAQRRRFGNAQRSRPPSAQ